VTEDLATAQARSNSFSIMRPFGPYEWLHGPILVKFKPRLLEETLLQFNTKQRHSSHTLPRNGLGFEAQGQDSMGKNNTKAMTVKTETKTKTENTASRLPRDEALP
jgi:hypothetical protein